MPSRARLGEIWRFYQAGVVNALVGFGLYALFVWAGLNIYVAQIVATILGVVFNYATYSRHVFRETAPAKLRFAMSYVFNYLISLGALALVSQFLHSPYVAGVIAIGLTSVVNYFALKYLVFTKALA